VIDPFTAFAMAQGAVKGIKAAIQLGKDVNGLYKEFSQFYESADAVHIASSKMRMDSVGKTDAQLSAKALEIAMASKALRDNERELKDLLFWSGNAPVWEEMQAERLRMMKERNAAEKAIADKKQKDREAMYNMIMNILLVVGAGMIIVPVITLTWHIITNRGF
jgi:hypothetical protein